MIKNIRFISIFTAYVITYLLIFSGMFVAYAEEEGAIYENTFYETELVRDPDKGSLYDKSDIIYKDNEYDLINSFDGKKVGKYNLTVENKISEKTIKDKSYFVPMMFDGKEVLELNEKLMTGEYYRELTDQYDGNVQKGSLFPKVLKEEEHGEFEIYSGKQKIEKDYYGNEYYFKNNVYRKLKQEKLLSINQKIRVYNWVRTGRAIEIESREDYYDGEHKYLDTGKLKYNYAVQDNIYRMANKSIRLRTMQLAQDAVEFETVTNKNGEELIMVRFITSNNAYILDKVETYESDVTERGSDDNRIEGLLDQEKVELSVEYEKYYNIKFQNIYKFNRVTGQTRRIEENVDEVKYEGNVIDFRYDDFDIILERIIIDSSNEVKILSVFDEYVITNSTIYEQNQILSYDGKEIKYYGKLNPDGTYSEVSDKIKKEWLGWSPSTPITTQFPNSEGYSVDIPYAFVDERLERETNFTVELPAKLELSETPALGYENMYFTLSDDFNLMDLNTKTYLIELNDDELNNGYQKTYLLKKNAPIIQRDILIKDGKLVVFNTHYIDGKNFKIINEEKIEDFYRSDSWIQPNDEGRISQGESRGNIISYKTIETGIKVNEYRELKRNIRVDSNGKPINIIKSKTKGISEVLSIGQRVTLNGKEYSITKKEVDLDGRGAGAYIHISSEIFEVKKTIDKNLMITIMFIGVGVAMGATMLFMFKKK